MFASMKVFGREVWNRVTDWELTNVYCRPNRHAGDPEAGRSKPLYWPMPTVDPKDPPVGGEVDWHHVFWKVHKPKAEAAGVRLTDEQWQERWEKFIAGYREKRQVKGRVGR